MKGLRDNARLNIIMSFAAIVVRIAITLIMMYHNQNIESLSQTTDQLKNLFLVLIFIGLNSFILLLLDENIRNTNTLHRHFNSVIFCLYVIFTICSVENLVEILNLKNTTEKILIVIASTQILELNKSHILSFYDPDWQGYRNIILGLLPTQEKSIDFAIANLKIIIRIMSLVY